MQSRLFKIVAVAFFGVLSAWASLFFYDKAKEKEKMPRNNPVDPSGINYQGYRTDDDKITMTVVNQTELTNGKTNIAWILYYGMKPSFYRIGFTEKLTSLAWKALAHDRLMDIAMSTAGTNTVYMQFQFFNGRETNGSVNVVYTPASSASGSSSSNTAYAGPTGYTNMVDVPGGTLVLTNTSGNDRLTNTVSAFSIGKYEVTYDLWYPVHTWATNNGYQFANPGREGSGGTAGATPTAAKYEPVTTVNWRDCMVWCNAYSEKSGLTPVYTNGSGSTIKNSADVNSNECDNAGVRWTGNGFRLPTEGEWQYAASYQNGSVWTPHTYASGQIGTGEAATNAVTWYLNNAGNKSQPVGTKTTNQIGIYDMSGNVWEWCWDWYGNWPGSSTDYRGAGFGSLRVKRGGSWINPAFNLQVGYRTYYFPDYEVFDVGFRLTRSLLSSYSVIYNGNGNTGGSVPTDANSYPGGYVVSVLGNTGSLVKTGFSFAGWTNAAGTVYTTGNTFAMGSANVTLWAKWAYNGPTGYTNMVIVPGGSFVLTNTADSTRLTNTVSAFSMGKYEVTYDLWYAVHTWATNNGYQFANPGREGSGGTNGLVPTAALFEPVTMVNWRDCIVWCNAYSEKSGLTPVYTNGNGNAIKNSTDGNAAECDNAGVWWTNNGYRLPTEGEWQYTASYRNGNEFTGWNYLSGAAFDTNNSSASQAVAWYTANSGNITHEVGLKLSNHISIFDMSGNIWEWCWDIYAVWPSGIKADYYGPITGTHRVIRGGSWGSIAGYCATGGRADGDLSPTKNERSGFRVAQSKWGLGITNNLVAYYSFDIDARDDRGNGLNGTVNGATFSSGGGKLGGAYSFDGVNDYILLQSGSGSLLNITNNITVSMWLKLASTNNNMLPLSLGDNISASGGYLTRIFGYGFQAMYGTSWTFDAITLSSINQWTHVVIVKNSSSLRIYKNGVEAINETHPPINTWNGTRVIGSRHDAGEGFFHGFIDEIGIWSRPLTPSEVQYLYYFGNGKNPLSP